MLFSRSVGPASDSLRLAPSRSALAWLVLSALGCSGTTGEAPSGAPIVVLPSAPAAGSSSAALPAPKPHGELDLDPKSFDFSSNPELAERIAETPHAYFRFTGHAFAKAICARYADQIKLAPRARLHGDPHVEQYTVSDLGRGLSDYDHAAVGPALVDLARMATSLVLATREPGGDANREDAAVDALLHGYAAGLSGKKQTEPAPAFAAALGAKFSKDRSKFLEMAEKNMGPLSIEEEGFLKGEFAGYERWVRQKEPKRSADFFKIKKQGRLKLGIGSALRKKYLLRLEGPSDKPEDDVIFEVKQVDDMSGIPCLTGIAGGAAERRADEQMAHKAGRNLLTPMLLEASGYWVNEWLANYSEARIKKLSTDDLEALAFEAGWGLAQEHQRPLPDGTKASASALAVDAAAGANLKTMARGLADEVTAGWKRFREEIGPGGAAR